MAIKLVRRPIPKSITQNIQREIKILADLGDGCLNIVHADEARGARGPGSPGGRRAAERGAQLAGGRARAPMAW